MYICTKIINIETKTISYFKYEVQVSIPFIVGITHIL